MRILNSKLFKESGLPSPSSPGFGGWEHTSPMGQGKMLFQWDKKKKKKKRKKKKNPTRRSLQGGPSMVDFRDKENYGDGPNSFPKGYI